MLREYLKRNANYYDLAIEKLDDLLSEDEKLKYFNLFDQDIEARFNRAINENFKILIIDREEKSAIIESASGKTYITTSRGCTCRDFSENQILCKHIIFLFLELGLIDKQGNLNIQIKKEKTPPPKAKDNVKICLNCGCIFSLEDSICPSCKSSNFKYKIPVENKEEDLDPIALIGFIILILFVIFCFVGMFL